MLRIAALVSFATTAVAPAQSPLDSVRLSRRALVLSFRVDSSTQSGPRPAGSLKLYIDLERLSPAQLELSAVSPTSGSADAGPARPVTCQATISRTSCRDSTTIELVNGRVVITVHDSAMLALLFVARPKAVAVSRRIGGPGGGYTAVHYVDPPFVPASTQALAAYDSVRGTEGWSPWTRSLWTSSSRWTSLPTDGTAVWIQAGDTAVARIDERQYRGMDQADTRIDLSAAGWTSSDSSAVAIQSVGPSGSEIRFIGLRPGRSRVAVHGLHGPSDALPRGPHDSAFTLDVVIVARVSRVRITPRPTTVVAGSAPSLEVQLTDERGSRVKGVPVDFLVFYDWPDNKPWGDKRYGHGESANFTTPGHRRFIASFGKLADTLDLEVVPRTR